MLLRDLRTLVGVQQTTLASMLDIDQTSISRLEAREDTKLSTLSTYVGALGGRLEVRVMFDDFEANITMPAAAKLKASAGSR